MRVTVAGVLAITLSSGARASEPEMFGMGARTPGMGATGVADADGYDATYTNPAGLVGPTNRRLTLGYVHAGYQLSLDGAHHPVDKTDGLILGADIPIPFGGILRDRVALGLGFYFPFGVINRARAPFPDEPFLPVMAVLNDVIGKVPIASPPSRHIDDDTVRVRKLPVPFTHAFSSSEVNVEPEEKTDD